MDAMMKQEEFVLDEDCIRHVLILLNVEELCACSLVSDKNGHRIQQAYIDATL